MSSGTEEKTNVTADASATIAIVPFAAVPSSSEDADAKAVTAAKPIRKPKAQPLKDKSDSEELTKRLNKLALERQKVRGIVCLFCFYIVTFGFVIWEKEYWIERERQRDRHI